jgi:hypothetical protein
MATNLTIDEVTNNVTLTVSNERGPAGATGPNAVTSATTSDGTGNLSLAAATVSGTLTASHIHGNLAGSIYLHIRAGEALANGDPVYVSGSHGTGADMVPIVSKADASNAAKMPAIAIMDAAVANNGIGHAVINGTISDLDTAAYSVNATLYVANGGGMTATKPANAQPVARVERSNANNGGIVVKVEGPYSAITIASSQVTDATSAATPSTIVKRNGSGDASFGAVTASTFDGNADPAFVKLGGGSNIFQVANSDGSLIACTFSSSAVIGSNRGYTLPDASGTILLDTTSTIAGAKTLTGQLELTGQAATNATSAMTRGLVQSFADLARVTWNEVPATSFRSFGINGASVSGSFGGVNCCNFSSGSTLNAAAAANHLGFSLNSMSTSNHGLLWNRAFSIIHNVSLVAVNSSTKVWLRLGSTSLFQVNPPPVTPNYVSAGWIIDSANTSALTFRAYRYSSGAITYGSTVTVSSIFALTPLSFVITSDGSTVRVFTIDRLGNKSDESTVSVPSETSGYHPVADLVLVNDGTAVPTGADLKLSGSVKYCAAAVAI